MFYPFKQLIAISDLMLFDANEHFQVGQILILSPRVRAVEIVGAIGLEIHKCKVQNFGRVGSGQSCR